MKDRIYVCHTYYHVYVTFLKELNLPTSKRGQATLLLSKMSIQFENLKERVEKTGLFEQVLEYDEKRADFFPELAKYTGNKGNIVTNMISRIQYTKKLARLNAPYVPVRMEDYKDIYVFCDIDPIGYYLNWKKIPYHAIEDGLNTLVHIDAARYDNRGNFKLKVFFSEKLNLILVQNGYGKYCIDMEVNDIAAIHYPCPKYIEASREALVRNLTSSDRELITKAFVRDYDTLTAQINQEKEKEKVLILTEPLCDLVTRERIFRDVILMFKEQYQIYIKPHPRDLLNYRTLFPEYSQFDAAIPMEIFNFFPNLHFNKVIGVLTEMNGIGFADEKMRLGPDFMDRYEEASLHRQNEQIGLKG